MLIKIYDFLRSRCRPLFFDRFKRMNRLLKQVTLLFTNRQYKGYEGFIFSLSFTFFFQLSSSRPEGEKKDESC